MVSMSKFYKTFIFFLIIGLLNNAYAYNVAEYDENEDVIISTTVFNATGYVCTTCDCNFSVFYPHPNANTLIYTGAMATSGNGVYTLNLTTYAKLNYSPHIYPTIILCNDSASFGGDTNNGIRIGMTMFDYTSIMITLIAFAFGFLYVAYKTDRRFEAMKTLSFFSGMTLFLLSLYLGYIIILQSPANANLLLFYGIIVIVFSFVFLMLLYLWIFHYRIAKTLEDLNKI